MARRPAVFADRDGTLIREVGHICSLDQVEIFPCVPEAVRMLRDNGFSVVVVTNQSAVARGLLNEEELKHIHREISRQIGFLDGIYYCPHHPTEGRDPYRSHCKCRKPNPGLVEQACLDLDLDVDCSYVVGDQMSDMELAARIGSKGILLVGAQGIASVEKEFSAAAHWIVGDLRKCPH
jgi:D-glycero-D-manno-heptose 1,7-bisphosphate phosphatase